MHTITMSTTSLSVSAERPSTEAETNATLSSRPDFVHQLPNRPAVCRSVSRGETSLFVQRRQVFFLCFPPHQWIDRDNICHYSQLFAFPSLFSSFEVGPFSRKVAAASDLRGIQRAGVCGSLAASSGASSMKKLWSRGAGWNSDEPCKCHRVPAFSQRRDFLCAGSLELVVGAG